MNLIYKGEFYSRENVHGAVHILSRDYTAENVGKLTFVGDEPLVFEWNDESKEVPLCGSTATLTLISPGDRTYVDLYTEDPTALRMDAYRNGKLYWSGCLDPEFYEEPYSQESNYEVSLTFSDFGALGRLRYDLADMQSLQTLIEIALVRCNINCSGLDTTLISSSMVGQSIPLKLSDLMVRSDNFYDEDGEALTLYKVIEGVLQPLALRMVQRCGKVWVYDLNGLYRKGACKALRWMSDDQMMSVDKVFNNAKITWSTYAQSGNLSPEGCWPESIETPINVGSMNNHQGGSMNGAEYFSYHYENKDLTKWLDTQDFGFTIWLARQGDNAVLGKSGMRFFKIVPQYDGTECEGVAISWRTVRGYKVTHTDGYDVTFSSAIHNEPKQFLPGFLTSIGKPLFKSTPIWIPPVEKPGDLVLRVALEMLLDPRFNPFESAENNEVIKFKDWYSNWNTNGNFVYVPVTVKFQPDGSDTVYVWDNRAIVQTAVGSPVKNINGTYGSWVKLTNTETPNAWGWFAYYDAKDRKETCGVLGWKKNRSAINPHTADTLSILTNAEDGQYIPYPNYNSGGKLWVEVCDGNWQISDGGVTLQNVNYNNPKSLWEKISWLLFKLPEIEIMNSCQFDKTINTDDVEYNAQLNSAAKDPIEIETICGTSEEGVPTARGAYFTAGTGKQIKNLTRAGRTATVEQLLIGTLYSQFASRKTRLDGTVEMNGDALCAYTEASLADGTLLIMTGTVENAQDDTMEGSFIELRPDEYDKA